MSEKNKKRHLTQEQVKAKLAQHGLESTPMTAFARVGSKDEMHVTISRADRVVRVYGHGFRMDQAGIVNFSDEERRKRKLGGIRCQLDITGDCSDEELDRAFDSMLGMVGMRSLRNVDAAPIPTAAVVFDREDELSEV